jgi:hypothetical protein
MNTKQYSFAYTGTVLTLRQCEGNRWALSCNEREVCIYKSPKHAAHFVSQGNTGNSLIDRMAARPRGIEEWQAE